MSSGVGLPSYSWLAREFRPSARCEAVFAVIGLIIELPDPILLVLLGQLSMVLPTEEAAVVCIRLDVLGILDRVKA